MRDPLFVPISLGSLEVANRIFMPAMHMNMCEDFQVTDRLVEFYRARGRGGAGLISVGYATIDEYSGAPGNIGAHLDEHRQGLSRLAAAIKEGGAKACIQLNHAGRYNASFFLGGKQPVAPSAIASRLTREVPKELEGQQIAEIISRFGEAAMRVRESGFDMVEVLAGTGYLISSFLSPLTNQRQDEYGGSLENRMRFGLEVVAEIRRQAGETFPVMVRINGHDFMEGGIGPDEMLVFAKTLEAAGVAAICVNVGWHEAQMPQLVAKVPAGVFAYLAKTVRQHVSVPVIASVRINDPKAARRLVATEYCDMVAIGRALIADPEFPKKAQEHREDEITRCVACGQGCFDNLFKMRAVECMCNPMAGYEYLGEAGKSANPRRVLVAGGGVAGLSAAISAAEVGHQVVLCEAGSQLGGQLLLAGAPMGRQELLALGADLCRRVKQLQVEVRLNTRVDEALLAAEKPEHLILATGGEPIPLRVPGAELDNVVQAWDVLAGKVYCGRQVVVIGGGAVGVETALMLAEEGSLGGEELKFLLLHQAVSAERLYQLASRGFRQVTLVELTDKLGENFGKSTRWTMLQDLERFGIRVIINARLREIEGGAVVCETQAGELRLEADEVVMAVGTRASNPLEETAKKMGIALTVIGDAVRPGTLLTANHQGFKAGRGIN